MHSLLEMAQIGVVDNTIFIRVYGNEGPIPHFHFYETQGGRSGCIKILEASYFVHGRYADSLKRWEREELMKWLKDYDEDSLEFGWKRTNWEVLCYEWNKNNPQYKLKTVRLPLPNYLNL